MRLSTVSSKEACQALMKEVVCLDVRGSPELFLFMDQIFTVGRLTCG